MDITSTMPNINDGDIKQEAQTVEIGNRTFTRVDTAELGDRRVDTWKCIEPIETSEIDTTIFTADEKIETTIVQDCRADRYGNEYVATEVTFVDCRYSVGDTWIETRSMQVEKRSEDGVCTSRLEYEQETRQGYDGSTSNEVRIEKAYSMEGGEYTITTLDGDSWGGRLTEVTITNEDASGEKTCYIYKVTEDTMQLTGIDYVEDGGGFAIDNGEIIPIPDDIRAEVDAIAEKIEHLCIDTKFVEEVIETEIIEDASSDGGDEDDQDCADFSREISVDHNTDKPVETMSNDEELSDSENDGDKSMAIPEDDYEYDDDYEYGLF